MIKKIINKPFPPGTSQRTIDLLTNLQRVSNQMGEVIGDMQRANVGEFAKLQANKTFQDVVAEDKEIAAQADALGNRILEDDKLQREKDRQWRAEDAREREAVKTGKPR